MIKIQFFSLLRLLLKKESLELPWEPEDTVGRVLERVQRVLDAPISSRLIDEGGGVLTGTIILVNRKNILHLEGLKTPLRDGDLMALFPPGAGG